MNILKKKHVLTKSHVRLVRKCYLEFEARVDGKLEHIDSVYVGEEVLCKVCGKPVKSEFIDYIIEKTEVIDNRVSISYNDRFYCSEKCRIVGEL